MQKLSAIMPDTNLAASSVNVVNSSGNSGDFHKVMSDMKNSGNSKIASATEKTRNAPNKNAVKRGSDACDNADDKVRQMTQKASRQSDVRCPDAAAEDFTKNDFIQVENEVKTIVKDVLNLDEDAFQQTIASMGITVMQLLDPNVLQQFVVQVNGGNDVTDLLTNEAMMQQFSELSAGLLETDWKQLAGLTGEQLSQMTADQFDDSDILQKWIDEPGGSAVDHESGSENVPVTEEHTTSDLTGENQKVYQAEDSVPVSGDTSETFMTEDGTNVPDDVYAGGDVNRQVMSEDTGREKLPVAKENSILMSSDVSGENESDVSNDAMMQNGFQNGSETESRSEGMVSYFESSPVTVTESQTVLNFVENMVQASNVEQVPEPVNMQQMIDIVNQVVERIHSSMRDETTTLEMQLNPERLGKMLLTVSSKEGVMTASFTVQNAEAKAALESQMITLRENLEQKNLKVEAVEVSVSDFAFSQSGQADTGDQKNYQQGNGKRSRFRYDSGDEETENSHEAEEQVRRSVMMDQGSSVDFTA